MIKCNACINGIEHTRHPNYTLSTVCTDCQYMHTVWKKIALPGYRDVNDLKHLAEMTLQQAEACDL